MSTICKECDLNVKDNKLEIIVNQLKREVENLLKNTNKTLLIHDGKIAELCLYIKDNLSNSLRTQIDLMLESGELDNLIINTISYELDIQKELYVLPERFGAVGDGITDDTIAIQSAINNAKPGQVIKFNKSTYLHDTIEIKRNDITLDGEMSTHILRDNESFGFKILSSKNVIIKNFIIKGNEKSNSKQHGITSVSGETYDNITIQNNTIDGTGVGISLNADLGGHLNNIKIVDNTVSNCKGTAVGYGYGIHIANGNDESSDSIISRNTIIGCERHSIYVARGRGYIVSDNIIKDHRKYNHDGSVRPALNVSRSSNVSVTNNKFINCYDGNMSIMAEEKPVGYPMSSYPADNIIVCNNSFTGPVNLSAIFIGYLDINEGLPQNINISNNIFKNIQPLKLAYGKNISYSNNMSEHNDFHIILDSMSNECSLYNISNNQMVNYETTKPCIRLNPKLCSSQTNEVNLFNNITNLTTIFSSASVITNPNITLIGSDSGFSKDSSFNFKNISLNS